MPDMSNRPLKILQVVPDMVYGGVEKVVLSYYDQLDRDRYVFDFVTHGTVQDYHQDLIDKGSKIYYLDTIGRLGYNGYKKQIQEKIKVDEYDIVHVHTGHLIGLYAKAFKSLKAKRIICHAHTTKCINPAHRVLMPILRALSNHYSDALVACGKEAGRFCFGNEKAYLLPNGINFGLYKDIDDESITGIKEDLGIAKDAFVVGHVGRFSAEKNHKFIVELIDDYVKTNPDAVFVLVGDGPLKPDVEGSVEKLGINKNVIFTGLRKDVPALMKMFDAFILPSLHEGLPVVSIEAQAAGTPCVISDTIDKTLDIGAGLISFLPITEGCSRWCAELSRLADGKKDRVSNAVIYGALTACGYEIKASSKKIGELYDCVKEQKTK